MTAPVPIIPAFVRVRCLAPLEDNIAELDERLDNAAGSAPDYRGTECGLRECVWLNLTLPEAFAIKGRLEALPFVSASVKENSP